MIRRQPQQPTSVSEWAAWQYSLAESEAAATTITGSWYYPSPPEEGDLGHDEDEDRTRLPYPPLMPGAFPQSNAPNPVPVAMPRLSAPNPVSGRRFWKIPTASQALVHDYAPTVANARPIRMRLDFSDTIKVRVGSETFRVPREALCLRSRFFRKGNAPRWREGQPPITLLDVNVEAFNLYLEVLCTGNVPMAHIGGYEGVADNDNFMYVNETLDPDRMEERFEHLVRTQLLAQYFMDETTANIITDFILRNRAYLDQWSPTPKFIAEVYKETKINDPMRLLMLALHIHTEFDIDAIQEYQQFASDFFAELYLIQNNLRMEERRRIDRESTTNEGPSRLHLPNPANELYDRIIDWQTLHIHSRDVPMMNCALCFPETRLEDDAEYNSDDMIDEARDSESEEYTTDEESDGEYEEMEVDELERLEEDYQSAVKWSY